MMDDEGEQRLKATYGDNYARRAIKKTMTERHSAKG
jgi:hypothetical protein